jgi:hypothetical protein
MGLLDYKKFLLNEADTKSIVVADKPKANDDVIGQVPADKIDRLKSQLQIYSLEAAIDNAVAKSNDPSLGEVLKRALVNLQAEKILGVSYVLSNKPVIKFNPSDYESSPSTKLWDTYKSFFTADLPAGSVSLSDSDLSFLWQIQDPRTGGSVGPGEIILTVFTDLKKGKSGDLAGSGFQMEVKGQNAKAEGYASWATVKSQLTPILQSDLGAGAKIPTSDGFTKEWAAFVSDWLSGNLKVRVPQFVNMITGTTERDYISIIETSITDKKLDYGVFACQIMWYSKKMPFDYLLAFADPNKNSPLSITINCKKGVKGIYSQLITNFKSPNWESTRNAGSLNINGTKS